MNDTIRLVELAAELGEDAGTLAARLGDNVLLDGIGMRIVEASVARGLLDQHIAAQAETKRRADERHKQRQARQAKMAESSQALRDHVQAVQRRQQIAADGDDLAASALATVLSSGDDHERKMRAAGRRMDAWLRGESYGGIIRPLKEE